jgi:hypothetical protein
MTPIECKPSLPKLYFAAKSIPLAVAENQPGKNQNRMTTPVTFDEFATLLREWIHVSCSTPNKPNLLQDLQPAFDRLAIALFRLQFTHNTAYRRLCEARNVLANEVRHWYQVPPVPASAFKQLEISCLAMKDRAVVFHSSGTTNQQPSRHFHSASSLALYEASLLPWFSAHLLLEIVAAGVSPAVEPGILPGGLSLKHAHPLRASYAAPSAAPGGGGTTSPMPGETTHATLMVLTPPPAEVPHSSLAHMFATVVRSRKWGESVFVGKLDQNGGWTLEANAAVACLQRAMERKQITLILGTAFSFVHLLDHLGELGLRFQLPAGSRVMETGGYKGRSRTLTRPELHSLITERLGVRAENIVCEYGMNELSSQAYDRVASRDVPERGPASVARSFNFPPWARVQVISPETGHEVAEGETGLIRVFDLANVYSVLAIQTEDLGIRRGSGFELIGRARAAEPRGCSLAAA